ncbi:MAG: hypothetical protein ABIG42_09395 [bacterium]
MLSKDKEHIKALLDQGQASIYLNEKLEDDDLVAIVNVSMDIQDRITLHVCRQLHSLILISAILENATLSFISRGYIYIMQVSLELLDNNHLRISK